ncbi:MAG TPA: SCO family protein, partial [Candidatus Anammoximicrobium sp.]|nr:SCO family protein [Candidatus Anammoximicrobium sp.]
MIGRLAQANKRVILACGMAGWLVLAGGVLAQRQEPGPKVLEEVGVDEQLGGQIPLDARFRDENGAEVALSSIFQGNRPAVLSLNYSDCPMLCTLVLNGLVDGLQELAWVPGQQFDVVSISIDPLETPQRARLTKQRYVRSYGRPETAAGWHFLTGTQDSIQRVADAVGFRYKYIEKDKQYVHAAVIMICTPQGRVSRYLYGVQFPEQTLRLSLVEAGEGKVGSTLDKVLLFCFHYDAEAGRYGPVARNIMKLGASMTCVVLVLGLIPFWFRRRRHSRLRPEPPQESPAPGDAPGGDAPGGETPLAGLMLPVGGLLGAPGGSLFFPQRATDEAALVDNV